MPHLLSQHISRFSHAACLLTLTAYATTHYICHKLYRYTNTLPIHSCLFSTNAVNCIQPCRFFFRWLLLRLAYSGFCICVIYRAISDAPSKQLNIASYNGFSSWYGAVTQPAIGHKPLNNAVCCLVKISYLHATLYARDTSRTEQQLRIIYKTGI